jgi:hypothetical protein
MTKGFERTISRAFLQCVGPPIHGVYDMKGCISGIERAAMLDDDAMPTG